MASPITNFKKNALGAYFSQITAVTQALSREVADERLTSDKPKLKGGITPGNVPGSQVSSLNLKAVACIMGTKDILVTRNPSTYPSPLDLHLSRQVSSTPKLISDAKQLDAISLGAENFHQALEFSAFLGMMTYSSQSFLIFVHEVQPHLKYQDREIFQVKSLKCIRVEGNRTATGISEIPKDLTSELEISLSEVDWTHSRSWWVERSSATTWTWLRGLSVTRPLVCLRIQSTGPALCSTKDCL